MTLKDKIVKGVKYGRLTLTGELTINRYSNIYVECVCDCGRVVVKRFSEVHAGTTKTCADKKCTSEIKKVCILPGQRYGRLELTGNDKMIGRTRYLEANCDCGTTGFYLRGQVFSGKTSSCGCYQKQMASLANTTHGFIKSNTSHHPLYNTWNGVKQRCNNPVCDSYINYGGRGIKMCDKWVDDFMIFFTWSIENGWRLGLSLDRKNNNEGYNPENCRWATSAQQNRNKRNNINITAFGETKCVTDWEKDKRCNVGISGLIMRIKKGWDIEKAITQPRKAQRIFAT